MKRMKRIAAGAASLAMIASMALSMPLGASAAGTQYTAGLTNATDGTNPVSQNTTTIDKYLVMDVNANVPNASFDFSIAPYNSEADEKAVITAASDSNLAVINGVTAQTSGTLDFKANDAANTGSATAGVVAFAQSDTSNTVTEGANGADTAVVWQDNTSANEKYAKKTLTLDFSTVQFTEPGVYRYLITETGTNQGVTNDIGVTTAGQSTYRTLDVYVEDYAGYLAAKEAATAGSTSGYTAVNGKELLITGYVLYDGKHDDAPAKAGGNVEKSTSYTNAYASQDLTFGKIVTGNQGSRDKYFKYTVVIGNITAENTKMTVDLSLADTAVPASPNSATDTAYAGKTNPAELVADTTKTIAANGYKVETVTTGEAPNTVTTYKITAEYYLQHGQYITVQGLPKETTYTITEAAEDYTAANGITDALSTLNWDGTEGNDALSDPTNGTIDNKDIHTGFTNTREGTIPTGVILAVAAPAGVGLAAIGGIAYLLIRNKRRKAEEE